MTDRSIAEHPSTGSDSTPWLLAICGLVAIALIAAAWIKGGYIDEYWTISFVDSTVPLRHAFEAWSMETGHAVGFYALGRLGDLALPPDLFVRRLSNLIYFAFALAVAWFGGRKERSFDLLYVATVAASPYVVERFAEYRAIFLALMLVAMLVLRVLAAVLDARVTRPNVALILLLMIALGLADYPTSIAGMALFGAWGLFALMDRDWKAFSASTGAIAACILTIAASIANAARFKIYPSPYFESFTALIGDLAVVIATGVLPCLAMVGLALVQVRRERLSFLRAATETPFLRVLLLALAFTIVGLFLFNAITHSLIRRQIFGIVPLVVAYLTALSFPHLRARPLTFGLIAANLVVSAGGMALALKTKPYFYIYGPDMAQAQRSCPSLPIYAVLPEKIVGTPDNRFPMKDQVAIGYDDVADRFGLRVRHDQPKNWIDPKCGAMVWSEYLWLNAPPTPEFVASKLGLEGDPQALRSAKVEYIDQSMLMRVPPPKD